MFSESAEVYDLIYASIRNYPGESERVAALIREHAAHARSILDIASGTGEHARLLTERHGFEVDGLDLDPTFVAIASQKLPRGRVHQGDMSAFSLSRRYDVLLCLFSSIGYVRTLDNLERAFTCFREHLAEGGVVIVEPWFGPDVLDPTRVFLNTAQSDSMTVARMSRVAVDGRLSRLYFEYLIGRAGDIQRASETHELGLFTTDETLECFRRAGLDAAHDPDGLSGRGLFVARTPSRGATSE